MAELAAFTDYEKEFTLLTNSLPARINTLLNYESSSDNAQTELRRIKQEMSQSKQLAMDMEIAARGIAEPTRRELGNKIRIHKETLATLQKDLSAAEAKFDRSALLGTRAAAPLEYDKSQSARDRATEATDKLRKGTTQLGDAQRRLEETIDVGSGIMSELDRNRETLQRVRSNVRAAPWVCRDALSQFFRPLSQNPRPHPLPLLIKPGWRGWRDSRYRKTHFARNGPSRDPKQNCGHRLCSRYDRRA